MTREQRETIFLEDAEILEHRQFDGEQFILRLATPRCAARAEPGTFVHLRCDADLPMRRPLSILRANAADGWVEVLYKTHGHGLRALARHRPGERLSVLGPIGQGFRPDPARPRAILLGGGVGIPPLLFLGERLAAQPERWRPVAFFGSELPFPFALRCSDLPLAGIPGEASDSLVCLEDWGIAGRLASGAGLAGCFRGHVTELARLWLAGLDDGERADCMVFACGPGAMLRAAQDLARQFELPSQLCLEEYMACAVGGCAGCAVRVHTPDGPAMRRVCVDGPVFDGYAVCA